MSNKGAPIHRQSFHFDTRGHRTGAHTDANSTPLPKTPGPPYFSHTRSAAGFTGKVSFHTPKAGPASRLPAMPSTRELANVSVLAVTTAAGWCLWMLMRKPVSYSFDNHNGVCQLRLSSFGRCRGHNLLGDPEWSGGGSDATNSSCVDTASVWQRKCGSTVNVIHTWTPSISLELSLAACTVSGHSTRRLASTSRVSLTPHTSGFPIAGYRYRLAHCSSMNAARATAR